MSPAPTSVTVVVVCPTTGTAVRTAVVDANSVAKAIEASSRPIFLIPNTPLEWSGGKKGDQTSAPACYCPHNIDEGDEFLMNSWRTSENSVKPNFGELPFHALR